MIVDKADIKDSDKLIFLHIPKTAGTSLRLNMMDVYGDGYFNLTPHQNINPDLTEINKYDAFSGHITIDHPVFSAFDRNVAVTVLRDPVERVISAYNYLLETDIHPLHEVALNTPLDEVLKNGDAPGAWGMSNNAVRFLGGDLEAAKTSLAAMTMVGFVENYGAFIDTLNESLPRWNVTENVSNVTRYRYYPESTKTLIAELNQLDIELYEYAKELPNAII